MSHPKGRRVKPRPQSPRSPKRPQTTPFVVVALLIVLVALYSGWLVITININLQPDPTWLLPFAGVARQAGPGHVKARGKVS